MSLPSPFPPRRIISLVPSQTELLHDLGLEKEVVGITKFCIHPESWFRTKTRVGGTKTVNLDKVRQLQPDLILANKEENTKEQIELLSKEFPVWVSDIQTLEDALEMIRSVGALTHTSEKANACADQIGQAFARLHPLHPAIKTAYLIWKDPYMSVGADSFIHDMMQRLGLQNCFAHTSRYPEVSIRDLQQADCQLLLLSSEPYPFKQKHITELQELLPHTRILLVDGEMFSWYGSRLLKAPAYFAELQNEFLSLSHAAGNR